MNIEIKNRYDGSTIIAGEYADLKKKAGDYWISSRSQSI